VWSRCAQSFFKNNNDRIPYFDIHYSLFDIRFFKVSFSIKLAVFLARGTAHISALITLRFTAKRILISTGTVKDEIEAAGIYDRLNACGLVDDSTRILARTIFGLNSS
jgi:hypothetical protein